MSLVNYNSYTGVLTIETTKPFSSEEITTEILAQKLILRHYRIDLNIDGRVDAGFEYRRVANLTIGDIIGNKYIIDDDPGANYFKLGLSRDEVWTHPAITVPADPPTDPPVQLFPEYTCQSTVRDCYIPLTMSGTLQKNFSLSVSDNNHLVFDESEFKYMFLQFEACGSF